MEQRDVARFAPEAEGYQWTAQYPQSVYEPGPDEDFSQMGDLDDLTYLERFEGQFFPNQYN